MSTPQEHEELSPELMNLLADEADVENDEGSEEEAAATAETEDNPTDSTQSSDDPYAGLDKKYHQKSIAEIAKMHEDAQAEMRRKANLATQQEAELQRLTKVTDELLNRQLEDGKSAGATTVTMDQLLENPEETIANVVKSLQSKGAEKQSASPQVTDMTEEEFVSRHEDSAEIAVSDIFNDWLKKSPARAARMNAAIRANDFATADEILTTYKEIHPEYNAAAKQAEAEREKGAKILSGNGSTTISARSKGKIFSEEKLLDLYHTNKDLYDELTVEGGEIDKAWNDGRVLSMK